MGCCSSKNLPPDRLGSEHGSVDESLLLMKECGEKWRMEPQKALNHFLKGTSEEDSYFGKDGSMFDYFQDDEFVELRLLLDEPLGRSHFLAHVERFSPSNTDLVRLWLFLHQYHTINAEDSFERYQAAKNLYKNYFHISPNAKQEAEEYRLSNCVPDIAEDDDDHEASINEKAEAAAFLEYHKMLVPSRCRDLPPFIIATIIKMRPAVEQALVEAQERLELTSPLNATAPGMALGGPEMRTRRFSSSLSNFVDWNGEKPRDLPEIPKIGGSEQEFVDAKQRDQGEEAAKAEVVEEDGVTLAQANDDEKETTTKKEDDDRQFPPVHLFIDLQNEVFIEMKPLYHHFKITSEDYEAYRKSKKIVYNHVEPKDFKYIQVLGKGGFGQVVHVVKRSTGKHYAMKVQAKDTLIDTWGGKMQHVEIERDVLVAHRSFPFIVSLRYAFQDDKYAFLCLDLAENGSLRALLEMSPGFQLGAPQVRLYVAEIVLALECLHDHEIIYRDLKPENVLLCADGHIMLADMGLAGFYYQDKYTREEEGIETNALDEMDDEDTELFAEFEEDLKSEHAQISDADGTGTDAGDTCSESGGTSSGEGDGHPDEPKVVKRAKTIKSHDTDCGTPLYRPPEMIRHEHYNEGVDWFMLGVFTYECLFGQLPFQPRADKISDSGMIELETDEDELKLLRKKVNVPASDPPTRELLLGLLDLNPKTRLGVGPAEMKRDLDSLKEHPYFIPITGPLATKCDWEKVLHKAYKPVYVPEERKLEEKSQFSSFDALVKSWKKNAKREAREYAKRKKKKADYNIQILKEGKPIDKSLEHYFDNWDYIDPESINLEKEAEKRAQVEESGVERTFSRASHIRSDLSKSFKRVRDGFKRQRTRSIDD